MALDHNAAQSYQTCAIIVVGVHPFIELFKGRHQQKAQKTVDQ